MRGRFTLMKSVDLTPNPSLLQTNVQFILPGPTFLPFFPSKTLRLLQVRPGSPGRIRRGPCPKVFTPLNDLVFLFNQGLERK